MYQLFKIIQVICLLFGLNHSVYAAWQDYQINVTLKSSDNDFIGVMFRYQDPDNYYRFTWDKQRNTRHLVKIENATYTLLVGDSVPYQQHTDHDVMIEANGSQLTVSVDGVIVLTTVDNTFSEGGVALYNSGNHTSYYKDLTITNTNTNHVWAQYIFDHNKIYDDFLFIDQGDTSGPANWSMTSDYLYENTNVYKSSDADLWRGTYALLRRSTEDDGDFSEMILGKGPAQTVNTASYGQQLNPHAASNSTGVYAIAWEDDQNGYGDHNVLVSAYDQNDVPLFQDIQANTTATGDHLHPQVAVDSQGNVLVVWQDDTDDDGDYMIIPQFNGVLERG